MIKDKILEKIKSNDQDKYSTHIGKITKLYNYTNCVDVLLDDTNIKIENIPLPIIGNGIKLISPRINDKVIVSFGNNNILQGKIVSYVDEEYYSNTMHKNTHISSGNYNNYIDYNSIDIKELAKPLNEYLIDNNNTDELKYSDYVKKEPIASLILECSTINNFDNNELGLIHEENKSIIKIKKDGSIDIFTSENNGLNISPITNTITILSDNVNSHSNQWSVQSQKINFNCEDFIVNSKNIVLNSNNIELQNNDSTYTINEVIERI